MAFPPPFPNPMMPRPQGQAPMMGGQPQKFGFFSPQTATAPTIQTLPLVGGIPIILRPPRHPFVRKPEQPHQYIGIGPPKAIPIPVTTVFIGNITDKCHDSVIQDILGKCGMVSNWKRLQDSNGKFKAFGFCDFATPEGARIALRVLKNYPLGDKRLNLKVDEETEKNLEEYAAKKLKMAAVNGQNAGVAEVNDEALKESIKKIIEEQAPELLELTPPPEETAAEDGEKHGSKDGERGAHAADRPKTPSKRKRSRSSSRSSRGKRSITPKGRHSRSKRSRHHSSRSSSSSSSASSTRTGHSKKSGKEKKKSSSKHSSRKTRKRTPSSEDSDAIAEKRRLKRELKEREENYLRRLKKWEDRERRMAKQYEKDTEGEEKRQRTIQKEAKKLRQFLEDYQDERDDPKYYKGSALFDRRRNYEREREADAKDRHEERKELEEVKRLILKDQRKEGSSSKAANGLEGEHAENGGGPPKEATWATVGGDDDQSGPKSDGMEASPAAAAPNTPQPIGPSTPAGDGEESKSPQKQQKVLTTLQQQKTLQAPVNGVFEEEEEEEDTLHQIKKKIKPFEITREDRIHSLTPEERKKLIKDLISRIPTEREMLFAFTISWEFLDEPLMEQRVRPWINKKICEYIGEEEPSLVSFICEKIEAKTKPDDILQDLSMVLDDEAEVFMVKLWRLIVYESEAKRLGLNVMPASKANA